MIQIRKYTDEDAAIWNAFNRSAKNYLFMFDRNYMDYHRDRFQDFSLLFFYKEKLAALFPASQHGNTLISHGGLTYGGFITDSNMKQHIMNDFVPALCDYCRNHHIEKIIYKAIPHIYHKQAAEEDRYALFVNGFRLSAVDVSSYLNLRNSLKMPKGRKAQIKRAAREGVQVQQTDTAEAYEQYIALVNCVLEARHGVHAVHTAQELKLLHEKFPENIHLFLASFQGTVIAGAVVYEYDTCIHIQYMAADDTARKIGALDSVVCHIANLYSHKKDWLDFGISTEHGNDVFNEGLARQKESFGGRTGVYEIWEKNL